MASYGVQYTVTLADLTQSKFNDMERSANRVEASIASLNGTLRTTAAAFGIGMGLHGLIDMGKDLVQTYADYEQSLLRIKYASKSLGEGVLNQQFIFQNAMKFKVPIEEATDAYGRFLLMVKNTPYDSGQLNKLHTDILTISKVSGLAQQELAAPIKETAKQLGVGVLEGRVMRQLERTLPQVIPYIAKNLNMDLKDFNKFIAEGLTKSGVSSDVLLKSFGQLADSMKGGLSESLKSTKSELADLHNAFFTMKMDLAQELKPEILSFINGLKEGAHWIKEHKDGLIAIGNTIVTAAKLWLGYRTAMLAVNGVQYLLGVSARTNVANITAESTAMAGLNAEITLLNTNLEILIGLQTTAGAGAMSFAQKRAMLTAFGNTANLPINMVGVAGAGSRAMAGAASFIAPVVITAFAVEAINQLGTNFGWFGRKQAGGNESLWDKLGFTDWGKSPERIAMMMRDENGNVDIHNPKFAYLKNQESTRSAYNSLLYGEKAYGSANLINYDEKGEVKIITSWIERNKEISDAFAQMTNPSLWVKSKKVTDINNNAANGGNEAQNRALYNAADKISGNRPVTYNITIKEMNGVKDSTFEVQDLSKLDAEGFGRRMADIMLSVVNDSQIRQGN